MFSDTSIDAATVRAYHETEYRVHADRPIVLRIGAPNAGLQQLHEAQGVASSAFLTACNPYSEALSDVQNLKRQDELVAELVRRGVPFVDGVGQHPGNGWPGEPSILALGLSLEDASELGRRFDQNAIVWCGRDTTPQLVLLR